MPSPLGRSIRRREDAALLTGRGRFVEDLNVPGTLYLAFARSPHAKARIVHIDVARARTTPGAVQIVTAEHLEGIADMPLNQRARGMQVPPNPVLARETVNAVGIGVAAVVAESRAAAEDAAALIEVEYAPLDGVASAVDALESNSPRAWDQLAGNVCFTNSAPAAMWNVPLPKPTTWCRWSKRSTKPSSWATTPRCFESEIRPEASNDWSA